jgi:hypothetical protein
VWRLAVWLFATISLAKTVTSPGILPEWSRGTLMV